MRRLLALTSVALLAGCGGGAVHDAASTKAPHESAGVFAERILREEINGQWAQQWRELHPAHQRLITMAQYVACSRSMATNYANGHEVYRVLAVRTASVNSEDVPQHTSKLVTVSIRVSGLANPFTYRVHAVNVGGHWAWILGKRFLAEIRLGRCLDGTRLQSSA
jgi:hypothetical protein